MAFHQAPIAEARRPTPAALPAELPQGTEHHAATADTVA